MVIEVALLSVIVLVVAAMAKWAFLPTRHLPCNRVRYMRIRLHLRLHPGKGFAHVFSLWLRWGRLAALRRSGRIRPSLPLLYRFLDARQHAVFLGRAHYRHGLRVPLEEHLLVMAPPRTYKTAFLADVILRYPGPVIATTTKPDVYALTAAVRAGLGARPRLQSAGHRRRAVYFLLVPGRGLRGSGHCHPPGGCVRFRRLPEGRRRRFVLVLESE